MESDASLVDTGQMPPTMTPGRVQSDPSRLGGVVLTSTRKKTGSPLLRFFSVAVAVAMIAIAFAGWRVISEGRQYDVTPTDAIVVLGASQYWGKPSPVLANRLDYAAQLYHDGIAPVIVTVGGSVPGDKTTEGQAGAEYLNQQGVPLSSIVAIGKGRDTIGSLEAVAFTAAGSEWESITLVSDRAHLARSLAITDALGLEGHVNGPASGDGALLTPGYVAKESAGLVRFYLWDRWQLLGLG